LLSGIDLVLDDIADGVHADDVDIGVQLVAEDGRAEVQVDARVPRAHAAGQTIRDLNLGLTAATPMAPWLKGKPEGNVTAQLEVVAREAGGAAGRGVGVDLTATAMAPIELLRRSQAAEPAEARLRLAADRVEVPGTQIQGIRLQLDARAWEITGERLDADLDTRADTVVATLDDERLVLSDTRLLLDASRREQQFDLRRLFLSTAETVELEIRGVVDEILGACPRFDDVGIRLGLLDLEQLLSLVPPSQRPELLARGSAEVRFALDGTLAYRELLRRIRLPQVESDDLGEQVQAYADYVERWEEAFRRGMPVVASLDISLLDLELESSAASLGGLALDLGVAIERHGPRTNLVVIADRIERPVDLTNLRTDVELSFQDGFFAVGLSGTVAGFDANQMARPIRNVTTDLSLRYRLGGDLLLDELAFAAPEPGVSLNASGVLSKPLRFFLARGWERPGLPGLSAALRWNAGIELGEKLRAVRAGGPELAGGLSLTGNVRAEAGAVSFDGILEVFDFHFRDPEQGTRLEQLAGGLPVDVEVAFDPRDDATILRRGLNLGSGFLAVVTSAEDIRKRPARPAYYERLRPYRQQRGLTFRSFRSGNLDIEDFELSGRITDGMLLVDRLGMHVLGGDVDGSLALQLGRDASLRTDVAVKVSNIDASYFKALDVEPGPSSELSADMQLGLLAAPHGRNLTFDMNITKMSTDTLDRFLLLLDGGDENGPNSGTRGLLGLVHLEGVKAWIRYENLNMDLDAAPILRIPGTTLGYPNIPPDIVRLQNLTVFLDQYAQPQIDDAVAPLLGWKRDDED
jgi:hypothetical protein